MKTFCRRFCIHRTTALLTGVVALLGIAADGSCLGGEPVRGAELSDRTPSVVVVRRRAEERIRYAFDLGARGAMCSARTEFIKALELVAQALDADEGVATHGGGLEAGLRALHEAEDFMPRDAQLDARWDLSHLVASHRTPVLKQAHLRETSLTAALQAYYGYATESLAHGGGHEPTASMALYGWARVEAASASGTSQADPLGGAKAIALHHAALLIDAENHMAANELGVLLARYGQMREAKGVLEHSLAIAPRAETWRNLATVCQSLGDTAAATEADSHAQDLAQAAAAKGRSMGGMVRWVDAETFVHNSGPDPLGDITSNPNPTTDVKPKPAAPKPSNQWTSWFKPNVLGNILSGSTRRTESGAKTKP